MHVKSFFAATVEAALAEGSRELGPEALIVQSRKAPREAQHLGQYEVVLGVAGNEPAPAPAAGELAGAGGDPLARELAQMRRQLDSMRRSLSHRGPSGGRAAPEIFDMLVDSETEIGLAQQIADAVAAQLGPAAGDRARARRAAAAEIASRVRVDATLGHSGGSRRLAAMIGPPGSGKTTTLVKLAALYGLAARRPALLLSADSYRIAAADQLRSFAAILGIAFELAETPRALDQALELHRGKELILLDTPGLAASEMDAGRGLAEYLAGHPEIDTHLVLSASMKAADITRAVDRFEMFRPAKLLFTRLDETCLLGPVLSEAARTGKPLSFFSAGQQIPEDLLPATPDRLAELVLAPEDARSRAAA